MHSWLTALREHWTGIPTRSRLAVMLSSGHEYTVPTLSGHIIRVSQEQVSVTRHIKVEVPIAETAVERLLVLCALAEPWERYEAPPSEPAPPLLMPADVARPDIQLSYHNTRYLARLLAARRLAAHTED
jgi:hypothetical protein